RGHALPAPDQAQVEQVPDGEHEHHHAEVGQRAQRRPQRDREQRRRDFSVKQGRPQQDAGDDLAEHRRLAEPLGRHTKQPGEQDNDGQVGQEQLDFVICHRAPLPKHTFARPARARALQYPAVIPAPAFMVLATWSARAGSVEATTTAISATWAGSWPAASTASSSSGPALAGSVRTATTALTSACRYLSALPTAIRSPQEGSVSAATMATSARMGASGGRLPMTCSAWTGLARAAARATSPRISSRVCALLMARAYCSASVSSCPAWTGSVWATAASALVDAASRKVP